jgi:anti-sigma regulatory factor (Ser/Thr protein kinase)
MYQLVAERQYPAAMDAPRNARRLVTGALGGMDVEAVEAAVLATSELTTNAVLHALGPFGLRLLIGPDVIRIEVSDSSPTLPAVQSASILRGGGRGLSIVEQVATTWGVMLQHHRPGKVVWCEIAIASPRRPLATH